jgi:Domain of unknown function (DUF4372)
MPMPPTLFSHLTRSLYATEFARAISQYPNRKPPRGLRAYDHFPALCFGPLTGRESWRDVVTCLNSRSDRLYHMGFGGRLTRPNLACGNRHRDGRLFQAVAQGLMRRAEALYPGAHYVMEHGYMDLARLLRLHRQGVYFVVRCNEPVRFKVLQRPRVDRVAGRRCDQKSSTEPFVVQALLPGGVAENPFL